MLQMKYKLCSLAIMMAGVLALAACSADDTDSSYLSADKNEYGASTGYYGSWQFFTNSSLIHEDWVTHVKSASSFSVNNQQMTIEKMPTDLFLVLAKLQGYEVYDPEPYTMATEEKGYSQHSVIYGLTTPDYVFLARKGDQLRHVRVSFMRYTELVVDTYLNTVSVMIGIKEVCVEDKQMCGDVGLLMYRAETVDN